MRIDNSVYNAKIIVIGGDNYNTLGIIRSLGEKKIDFDSIIIRGAFIFASKSKYLKNKRNLICASVEDAYKELLIIKNECTNREKIFLIVEGDYLTGFLDRHYDALKDVFIWNNAGKQGRLTEYLGKQRQIELVSKYGIKVLPSRIVEKGYISSEIQYPVMTKAISSEVTNWKDEVFICNNQDELLEAYGHIKSERIILQKYIHKKNELCLDGYSVDRGKKQQITIASTYNYILDEKYSFYCTVKNFDDSELLKKITEIMTDVGYEGIYCIEFIIDQDGTPYFLEINFRNSGWSYASSCLGMPLPILWIQATLSGGNVELSNIEKIPEGYTFIEEFSDFKVRAGKLISYKNWIKEYMKSNCKLNLGKNDSFAFLAYVFYRLIFSIKRKIKI